MALAVSSAVNILTFSVFYRVPMDAHAGGRLASRVRRVCLTSADGAPVDVVGVASDTARRSATCVLYSHGNAEHTYNRRYLEYMASLSSAMGCDVVTYDYVGYGQSSGKYVSTQARCMHSINAAYAYATALYRHIVLVGWSLGSAPTLRLSLGQLSRADPTPITGVVLLSPLLSAIRTRFDTLGRALRPFDLFDNDTRLRKHPRLRHTHVPYRILHGADDRVIPAGHSATLRTLLLCVTTNVRCHFLDRTGHTIPMEHIVTEALPMVRAVKKCDAVVNTRCE